jgi:outer membrane protein OmpA-like peptidoglycan-associated protein
VEPFAYTWSNRANTKDLLDVGADSYTVMIADANGCLRTLHSQITEPPLLNLTIDSVRNVKCCGDNSGAIFISVEGGVKPYKYEWSNGATTEDIQNLILGVYTVNVTDANGCVVSTPDDMTLYEQVVSKGMFTTRDILFDVGKSTIKPESFTTINRIASFMKEHPDISFRIDGHTDSDGSAEFNQKLSEDRAKAIRAALIKFGIRDNRLDAKGWGESKPISTNLTTEGKSLNRRVEFIALTGTLEGTLIEPDAKSLPK